jgi:hypothetical protein
VSGCAGCAQFFMEETVIADPAFLPVKESQVNEMETASPKIGSQ